MASIPESPEETNLLAGLHNGAWLQEQELPEMRFTVNGILPEGFSLLVGPPKAGKSWMALNVLLAVASGGRAFGKIPVGEPRPVFYLALEDGNGRMQKRCWELLEGAAIPEEFHYLTSPEPGRIIDTVRAFLALRPDTALVVLDTLGKVLPPAKRGQSDYQRDYEVTGQLKRIADDTPGLAMLALHHDRKAESDDFVDSVSGTHGIAGAADTVIVLKRRRNESSATLKVTGRDVEEAEYALTTNSGRWVLDGEGLAKSSELAWRRDEQAKLSESKSQLLAFVDNHPDGVRVGVAKDEFGEHAGKYLERLEKDGFIRKVGHGLYAPLHRAESRQGLS